MRKYKVKFAFSMYETIEAKNKQEAKEKYIARMKEVMSQYELSFDDDCIKAIVVKCV